MSGSTLASKDAIDPLLQQIWPHMIHAWPLWSARPEPARRALGRAGAFIKSRLPEAAEDTAL